MHDKNPMRKSLVKTAMQINIAQPSKRKSCWKLLFLPVLLSSCSSPRCLNRYRQGRKCHARSDQPAQQSVSCQWQPTGCCSTDDETIIRC